MQRLHGLLGRIKPMYNASALNRHAESTLNWPLKCRATYRSAFKKHFSIKVDPKIQDESVLQLEWRKKFYSFKTLGLLFVPIFSFGLGWWQYRRKSWKEDLLGKVEEKAELAPVPCPLTLSEELVQDWQYRKVYIAGKFDHSKEMLVGPVTRDGVLGFNIVTPLVREDGSRVLVQRGWISKKFANQSTRRESLTEDQVGILATVSLGQRYNPFTPDSKPEKNEWFVVDRKGMAEFSKTQPYLFEQIYKDQDESLKDAFYMKTGHPAYSYPSIDIPNNHLQYMFIWFSLSVFTSVMFVYSVRKPRTATTTISELRRKAGSL